MKTERGFKTVCRTRGDEVHEQRKGFFNKMKDALGM